jgi:membrane protease YdiL (CAAX protease family)
MKLAAIFVVLLFGFSWSWSYVARSLFGSGDMLRFLAGLLPSVWAPTVIAVILTLWVGGTPELRRELKARLSLREGSGRWLALAAGVPIVVTAAAMASARTVGDSAPYVASSAILPTIGLQVVTGALGEELGWRGYLLPHLGKRAGAMSAALVMSALWALWHVPAFFTPGMPHQFIPMAPFLLLIAFFGLFLALVFNEAGASVLTTMLAHLSLNLTLAIGGVDLSSSVFWWAMAAIFGVVAAMVIIRLRTRVFEQRAPA